MEFGTEFLGHRLAILPKAGSGWARFDVTALPQTAPPLLPR
jgi:hypothetical protein